jgi:hypothetical protein
MAPSKGLKIELSLRALIHDYINMHPIRLPVRIGTSKWHFVSAGRVGGRVVEKEGEEMTE